MKVLVVYYSMYGHVYKMAEAAAEGARSVGNVEAPMRRVPETLPKDVLEKMGAVEAQKQQADVPVCTVDELGEADAIIFGTPTRFGNMCGQMRQFLDATGQLWMKGIVGRESGKRCHQLKHPARRAGIYDSQFPHDPAASWHDHCRPAVRVQRANDHG